MNEFFSPKGLPQEDNMLTNSEEMKIPIIIDQNFSKYIQKFMHSYRNKDHPTININNLLILSGPEKNGKSWFLRHNLKKFSETISDKRTMTIHYDLRSINNQNFNSFLHNFENEIINSIVERNNYELITHERDLITVEKLKKILFFRWEKGWLEINLSKNLYRSLNENESAYTFYIDCVNREEILSLLESFERKAYNEHILVESIDRIIEIISQSMGIDKLEAGLRLIQDCLIQKEDLKKNQSVFSSELHRDGLEVMEYFFDVLNYMAGYHETQLEKESTQNVDIMTIYPHIVLALESVQLLFEMKDAESRPIDYVHRIMLRLYVKIK